MLHQPPIENRHFSAEVRLELRADGRSFDLASVGPEEIILREHHEISPCDDAVIVMFIDNDEFQWSVRLPDGAVPFDREVRTFPLGDMKKVSHGE